MNKYKKLAFNTVIFAIGSFGSKILSIMLTRFYTTYMFSEDIGTKGLVEMCANFLVPVVSFSIADAVIRYGLDENYDNRNVFSNAVVIFLFGVIGFLLLSPLLLLYSDIRPYVFLLAVFVCTSCFRQLSTQFARARGYVKLYAADGIACTFTLLLFNILFISILKMGVTGFMLATICSDFCSGVTVWLLAGHSRYFSRRYVDRELLGVMLRFSLPLIPTALLWIITGFSDRVFIREMLPNGESAQGVYELAAKVPNLISVVSTIFYQAWNMSAIAEDNSKERHSFYTQIYGAYTSVLFMAAACVIALAKPISAILIRQKTDPAFETVYLYTPVLVIAVLMMCLNQFLSSIYTVSKHTKNSFWTSVLAAGINLPLNALLIPKYGIHGAVAATFVSYFISYVVRVVDARRFISFDINHLRFAVNLAVLFALSGVVTLAPAHKELLLTAGVISVFVLNFNPLMETAKKLLKR